MTQLVVGSYNLLGGGIDNGDDDRLRRQLGLLRSLDVDVAGVQEAKWWERDGNRLLHFAEQELGLRGYLAPSSSDGCHLVLFIRESRIRVVRERHRIGPPYWHGLARLEVRVEGFPHRLDLVNAHLAPSSPTLRLAEAETFQLLKKHPTIAVGDWNAAPAEGVDPPLEGLDVDHARRKLDRRAAKAIEAAGFIDVGAHLRDDTPTVGYARADRLAYRCDRGYVNLPGETVIAHKVIGNTTDLSDHCPVVFAVDLGAGES